MRITSHLGRRTAALFAAGAVAASLSLAVAAPAEAATSLGRLVITPATGTESTGLTATLSAPCPDGSTGIVGHMSGANITEANDVIQSFRTVSQSFFVDQTFKDVFAANSISAPSGAYTVRMACLGADFFTEVGEFSQVVNFTPRGGGTIQNGANFVTAVLPTTTTLSAPTPTDPVIAGTTVSLEAAVDGGEEGTPTGSVQFKAGATNLGSPVALTDGAAALDTGAIPAGSSNLTAVYVPSGLNALDASTSNAVSYAVAGPTTITGTAKVGGVLTCNATTGGTKTYLWKKGGVSTGVVAASVAVPAAWLNGSITCDLTSTKGATAVTRSSNAVTVGIGVAPVAKVKPKVLGIMKVGKRLTCSPGSWSPAATSYKYQWLRSGRPIAGKVAKTYRTIARDKGKLISCKVTALRTGHLSGVAKSPARKVT